MSEYAPGTVAMAVRADGGGEFLVVRTRGDGDYWSAPKGWPAGVPASMVEDYRPLVVIDPEDREQVERLTDLALRAHDPRIPAIVGASEMQVDATQAALREFANPKPPKPPEPTGLGAVVEDDEGERWIRTCEPCEDCLNKPWQRGPEHRHWQIVDAVRVLSPGVES